MRPVFTFTHSLEETLEKSDSHSHFTFSPQKQFTYSEEKARGVLVQEAYFIHSSEEEEEEEMCKSVQLFIPAGSAQIPKIPRIQNRVSQ